MIRTFRRKDTEALFLDVDTPRFRSIERVARRKLLYLHQARQLADLQSPPGNRLETLKGTRKGQHSIRINDQWRVCSSGTMEKSWMWQSSTTTEL